MCTAAGNDIIMPGNPEDDANIREAVANGKLTEEQVRVCAGRILDMIYNLSDCEKGDTIYYRYGRHIQNINNV